MSSARRIASFASGVPRRARESSTGKGLLLDAFRFIEGRMICVDQFEDTDNFLAG